MATATMATAAGAAALLYYTLNKKLQSHEINEDDKENGSDAQAIVPIGIERVSHRVIQAPATWLETISTLSETLRFTYSETLAKWPIGDLAFGISFLLKSQIVGHSLGGGTAALLTYILREQKTLSVTTCLTFAPAACMTWELADSGNGFITSVINEADLVPTFSAASADDLRSEVTASAWTNDLRNQIKQTRILSTVYRSASALGSRLPSVAAAREKLAGAGAILQPVSNHSQVVMKRAKSMAQSAWTHPTLNLSSWSCMRSRHQAVASHSTSRHDGSSPESLASGNVKSFDRSLFSPKKRINSKNTNLPESSSIEEWYSEIGCANEESPVTERAVDPNDRGDMMDHDRYEDQMSEVELWQQLEHELYGRSEPEETDVVKEIREEEATISEAIDGQTRSSAPKRKEVDRFFPAGKIMHIVTLHYDAAKSKSDGSPTSTSDHSQPDETRIGIFQTPRSLYSKIRLSQTMICDT